MSKNSNLYDDFEDKDNPFINPFDNNNDDEDDDDILKKHIPSFIKDSGDDLNKNDENNHITETNEQSSDLNSQDQISYIENHNNEQIQEEEHSQEQNKNDVDVVTATLKHIYNTDDKLNHTIEQNAQFLEKYSLLVTVVNVCRQLPDGRILSSNTSKQGSNGTNSQSRSFQNQHRSLNNFRAGDVILYLEVSTNLPTFRKKANKNVIKSYKEFENFAIYLQDFRINNFHEFFPPAIPLNKTSYGLNNTEDLIQCKLNFQKWFDNRIVKNVPILKLEELSIFLESDFNSYIPMNGSININNNTTTSMTSANHSKDSMNSNDTMVSPSEQLKRKTLKQLQPPFDPIEDLAIFRPMIKTWRKDLQVLQTDLFKYCKYKQQLSTQETNLGKQFLAISDSTDMIVSIGNKNGNIPSNNNNINNSTDNFHNMYKRVGKTLQTIGDLNSIMATFDMAAMYDDLEWCGRDLYNVKEQLTNRHFLMRDLKNVSLEIEKNEQNLKKLKMKREIDPLRVHDLVKNLQRQKELQLFYRTKLERLSTNLIIDKENVLKNWEEDTIATFKNFALRNIEYERKKLTVLERVKNDVRRTDKLGGLSRLGRKNLEPYSNNSENSSEIKINQEADSWSGDTRLVHSKDEIDLKGTLFKTAERLSDSTKEKKHKTEDKEEHKQDDKFNEDDNYFTNIAAKKYAASLIGHSGY
ncbi:hypothetical protein ACO0SA_001949 [Hanseniaspora valbyensis]